MSTLDELPMLPVTAPSGPDPAERDRLIRGAKALSWLSLAWMTVEGTVAITAALIARSVALLGFGIDSAIEGLASVIVIWRFTGDRRRSNHAELRAQRRSRSHSSYWPLTSLRTRSGLCSAAITRQRAGWGSVCRSARSS